MESRGTSHWIDFSWDDDSITFADLLEVIGELPIPPYLNRETQESDKETYQTVYSKIKGSVAAPTAGLHFTERVLAALDERGIDREELTLHVGAGTFKPVKSEEIEGHEMHTEYISVSKHTIEKLIAHNGKAIAVGTTSVRTLESLYYIGVLIHHNPDAAQNELHVQQWMPYEDKNELTPVEALQQILDYLHRHEMEALHSSTQIIIAPGYQYKIVRKMVTNFHQPQSTKREVREELGITDFTPETVTHYVFESAREKELVFVHKTIYDGEILPSDELDGGRFWTIEEIKENLGKGIFTPNFEGEIDKVLSLK